MVGLFERRTPHFELPNDALVNVSLSHFKVFDCVHSNCRVMEVLINLFLEGFLVQMLTYVVNIASPSNNHVKG